MKSHRIAAVIGLILISASIVCIILCGAMPALTPVLSTAAMICLLAALAIMLALNYIRKKAREQESDGSKEQK